MYLLSIKIKKLCTYFVQKTYTSKDSKNILNFVQTSGDTRLLSQILQCDTCFDSF